MAVVSAEMVSAPGHWPDRTGQLWTVEGAQRPRRRMTGVVGTGPGHRGQRRGDGVTGHRGTGHPGAARAMGLTSPVTTHTVR